MKIKGREWLRWAAVLLAGLCLPGVIPERVASQVTPSAPAAQSADLAEAQRLSKESGTLYKNGEYNQAIPLAERALAIYQQVLGLDDPDVFNALNHLAALYYRKGDYLRAETLFQRALAIAENALGLKHPIVASTLNNLAAVYQAKGDYARAEPLYQRALTIRETTLGPKHPDVATSLNSLAALYQDKGDYARAEQLYQRSLTIIETALSPQHPNLAITLNNLAMLYRVKGDYSQSESLYLRVLTMLERSLAPEHPDIATSLNNLAVLYSEKGDYARAEQYYGRALLIREKALGPEHLDVATSLNNLAALHQDKGDYALAESYYERAKEIYERVLGPEHPHIAHSLNNLGTLYYIKGDYARTVQLYQRAKEIYEKALGPEHLNVATSLNNLATLYREKGNFDRAEPLLKRAREIYEKVLGPEHPDLATALNNLAALYRAKGDFARAELLYQRALAIQEKALGPEHPSVALSLHNLALLYNMRGDLAHAEPLYQRALAIRKKVLGSQHPDVATTLADLASLVWRQGDTSRAVQFLSQAVDIREHNLRLILATGSEDQKRAYMITLAGETDAIISLHMGYARGDLHTASLALATLLQRKGRVLDVMAESVAGLRHRLNPDDLALLDQLSGIRTQLATLVFERRRQVKPEQYLELVVKLEDEAQALERKISARSAEFRVQMEPVTLERVQHAIPVGAVLVEIVLYRLFNPNATKEEERWGVNRYAAYVLHSQGGPAWIELGEAAPIDKNIKDLRTALSDPHNTYVVRVARKLDEQIMRPIRKLLGRTRVILLSPDSALNLIPFGALVDEDNRYLIEQLTFTYLTTGRDLLRLQLVNKAREDPVMFANPDYGPTGNTPAPQTTEEDRGTIGRRSVDFSSLQFTSLPGTAAEAQAIKAILPDVKVLTGKQAAEWALKQVRGPRILHMATHGFFLPDLEQKPVTNPLLKLDGGSSPRGSRSENPLLRSGLALAGANRRESGTEDGVLTALEATGLDLWGTKLVVLSACETGVGDVQNGEGVYGLRRALVIAGSESQVMSLWQVDDKATRDLMVDYYQRLKSGEGRSEALRQAQLKMMKSVDRNHSYYWASFIPSGAWANLDGKVVNENLTRQ